jgi:hypothetical protein
MTTWNAAADPPRRIVDLELHEISCVDSPANEGAKVILFKSAGPMDEIQKVEYRARHHVSRGELAEAIALAKAATPAPRSFWIGALEKLAEQIAPGWGGRGGALCMAMRTPDGAALLAALQRTA